MKNFTLTPLLSLCLLLALSTVALAADPAVATASPFGAALSAFLGQTVFPLIGALVAGVAVAALRKFAAKIGMDQNLVIENFVRSVAYEGVAMAEEKAATALKNSGIKVTSDGKLDLAVAHILAAAPQISRERAESIVQATLAKIPGLGATGPNTVAAPASQFAPALAMAAAQATP